MDRERTGTQQFALSLTYPVCWSALKTCVVIQHRVWNHRRIVKAAFCPAVFHVCTADPPRSILSSLFPFITVNERASIVSRRSRYIPITISWIPLHSLSLARVCSAANAIVLVKLWQVSLTVTILADTVWRSLVIRLIVLLWIKGGWPCKWRSYSIWKNNGELPSLIASIYSRLVFLARRYCCC